MVFSSPQFLFYFLPLVLLAYYVLPRWGRNLLVVAVSVIFYAWSSSDALWILAVSLVTNYILGLTLDAAVRVANNGRAAIITALAIAFNLALLGYFKYANFAVSQVDIVRHWMGGSAMTWMAVALPVGISFYTFHSLSYIIDIRRRITPAFTNPVQYALYIVFFPQLIAGPIIRFHQIASQIKTRTSGLEDVGVGAVRFCLGLAKKVLIADRVGEIANAVFATPPEDLATATVWLGAMAYAFQLYFDFSGYSDMAIGLGRMFGFQFPENFRRPYSAISITDFWRRWHMTLSAWFRDYLYVPLGGSRRGPVRSYVNLALVFLAVGLWHGANWTFLMWGVYHGALLIAERVTGLRATGETASYAPVRRAVTFALVVIGWVLFRSDDIPQAIGFYQTMFTVHQVAVTDAIRASLTHRNTVMLVAAAAIVFAPQDAVTGIWLERGAGRAAAAARLVMVFVIFPLALISAVAVDFHPFLYFRF